MTRLRLSILAVSSAVMLGGGLVLYSTPARSQAVCMNLRCISTTECESNAGYYCNRYRDPKNNNTVCASTNCPTE